MLDQINNNRLIQAVTLANSGRRPEAAPICREVLATNPHDISALLWLAYTTPNQIEAEEAVAKAYDLQPQNPAVLQAVNWYNTHFVETPADAASTPPPSARSPQPEKDLLHTSIGEPVQDAANFFMSQAGSMVIGSTMVMIINLGIFLNYAVIRGINWTPLGAPRVLFIIIPLGLGLIAAGFLVFAVKDVITPPIKAFGFIRDRKEIRRNVRDRLGDSFELHYELQFLSDEAKAAGLMPVRLTLTKAQYDASARSNRAYVEFSKTLGSVRVYQPLRSAY